MLLVALARSVHAQPEIADAERLFEDARGLLKSQRYAEACDKFARSFALGHIIGAELNLGECAEREGRLAAAWRLFDAAAGDWERAGESERARGARGFADRVAAKLATIIVTLGEPSIAGLTVRIGDREVPPAREIREVVDPGDVEVEIRVPGRPRVRQTVHARAGAVASIDVPAGPPALEPPVPAVPLAATAPRRSRVVPLAFGGGAIAAAGAALLLWNHSDDTYATSRNEADDGKQRDLFHSANLQYRVAQGLGVAGIACAGVAVWLYLRGGGQERSATTARLRLAPVRTEGRTGVVVEGWY